MGTRGHMTVMDGDKTLVTVYRQFDTYPTGLGKEIQGILNNPEIVNGYGQGMKIPTHFNGMGCMAAYLIGKLKGNDIGNVYITPPNEDVDLVFIEYQYFLYEKENVVFVKILGYKGKLLYDGLLHEADMEEIEKADQ